MRAFSRVFIAACLVMAYSGCPSSEDFGEDGRGDNSPPRIRSIELSPSEPEVGEAVFATARVKDAENDPAVVQYEWYVDSHKVPGAAGKTFSTSGLKPGQEVWVRGRAVELESGLAGEWKDSASVKIKAVPVKLRGVRIEPDVLFTDTDARAVPDYGSLTQYDFDRVHYRWTVNENEAGYDKTLASSRIKRGDVVKVEASTREDFAMETTVVSSPKRVQNSAPVFRGRPSVETSGNELYIRYSVSDPDGDSVNVKVSSSLPGVRSAGTGVLAVNVANARPGGYSLSLTATDGHGGSDTVSVNIRVPE